MFLQIDLKLEQILLQSEHMREDYSRHYRLQAAFTGPDTQTGLMVEPCRIVMDMVTAGKRGHQQDLGRYSVQDH